MGLHIELMGFNVTSFPWCLKILAQTAKKQDSLRIALDKAPTNSVPLKVIVTLDLNTNDTERNHQFAIGGHERQHLDPKLFFESLWLIRTSDR